MNPEIAVVAKELHDDGVLEEARGSGPKLDLSLVRVRGVGEVVADLARDLDGAIRVLIERVDLGSLLVLDTWRDEKLHEGKEQVLAHVLAGADVAHCHVRG